MGVTRTIVAGGPATISNAVVASLPGGWRVSGADRYSEAAALATLGLDGQPGVCDPSTRPDRFLVAAGSATADAFTAATLAARLHAPLLLTDSGALSGPTASLLAARDATTLQCWVVGGSASVQPGVYTRIGALFGLYTLAYTAGTGGTINGTSPQSVIPGASGTTVTAVPNMGYHFTGWSDGSTANPRTDTNVTTNVSVTANFAANARASTGLSISAAPTPVKLPTSFVLSGVLSAGTNGLPCVVYVKKPASSRWSYSSNRLSYGATASASSWWYRYTPKLRGTYSFYVTFAGDATHLGSTSKTITVAVK